MKQTVFAALAGLAVFCLFSCGVQDPAKPVFQKIAEESVESTGERDDAQYLILTHSAAEDSLTQQAALLFQERLERLSGGKWRVDLYPNDTLGNLEDGRWYFSNGSIDMRIGAGPSNIIPILGWAPILTGSSPEELDALFQGNPAFQDQLEQESEENGARILGLLPGSYRVVTSKKEIRSLEDMEGVRMRVLSGDIGSELWKPFGMEVLPYDVGQVYLALQQNAVDAQENTVSIILDNRLYEQQSYLIQTNFRIYLETIYISSQTWDLLSPEDREVIQEAADQTIAEMAPKTKEFEETGYQFLEEHGVTVLPFPDSERERAFERMRPLLIEFLSRRFGAGFLEELMGYLESGG